MSSIKLGGSGAGASAIDDLTDVNTTGKADQNQLKWDATAGEWVDFVPSAGSGANLAWTASTKTVSSDTGTNAVLTDATGTDSGLMSAADKTAFDLVEASATADQTGAQIKVAYEAELNTNAYTDAEVVKVGFISVTQAVDLDTVESDTATNNSKISYTDAAAVSANTAKVSYTDAAAVSANTAKVTNATHTGDVTGATALTLSATAISGKTLATVVGADHVLIFDATDSALKKALASTLMARANHTGSQTASTISNFTTTVSSNTAVAANTAKISYTDAAAVSANTAKVTNATHTGDVTGSTALTLSATAISGQTLVTAVGTDHALILDATDGSLKKALVSDFAGSGATNLTWTASTKTVASDTGTDAVLTDATGTDSGLMPAADFTKVGFISVTQPVDLDTIESNTATNNAKVSYTDAAAVSANTSKVTNATHAGDVTGSTALTLASVAISGQTLVTAVGTDHALILDATDGTLKKALVSDFAGSGATNLSYTAAPTNGTVTSDTGTDATLTLAGSTNAGLMTPADFDKLAAITGTNTGDEAVASTTVSGTVELATAAELLTGTDTGRVASVDIMVDGIARKPATTQSATTYSIDADDEWSTVILSNAALVTVTIPTNATTALPVGYWCQVWFTGAAGGTMSTTGITTAATKKSASIGEGLYLEKLATDTWAIVGGTAT